MARLASKHPGAEQRFYPAFDGGLNLRLPPESIAQNELGTCVNLDFSPETGNLRTRGGLLWSGGFGGTARDATALPGLRGFLVRRTDGVLMCFRWNCSFSVDGTLSGDEPMSVAAWEDDSWLVASGGRLQRFRYVGSRGMPELTDIASSPEKCFLVFVRNGRVGVVTPNDDGPEIDTIRFSALGDCESWESDPEDDSSAQFTEVGYKDGMDINAVVPLSKDLIIFKSPYDEPDKGTVWRLTGDFPDSLALLEVAHNTGTFSQESAAAVGNDVFYLTPHGLATLGSVTEYGEVKTSWPDVKVSRALAPGLRRTARLWNIPVRGQVWTLPMEGERLIWVYDCGRGTWTQFEFPEAPVRAAGVDNQLYLFIGNGIYSVGDWYGQDELDGRDPEPVEARARMGSILKGHQTLVKGVFASFSPAAETEAVLDVGGFKLPLRSGGTPNYIYGNETVIFGDEEYIIPGGSVSRATRRCLVRDWSVTPELRVKGGGFGLSTLGLEIAEV